MNKNYWPKINFSKKIILLLSLIFLLLQFYYSIQCNSKNFNENSKLILEKTLKIHAVKENAYSIGSKRRPSPIRSTAVNSGYVQKDIIYQEVAELTKISQLKNLIDQRVKRHNDYSIALEIQKIARESFLGGDIAYLYPCENWLLYFISQIPLNIIINKEFNAVYDTERQLVSPVAFCSQNALVVQRLLKEYSIEYSSVGVGLKTIGHWASAAKLNNEWYYLDGAIEYEIEDNKLVKLSDLFDTNNELALKKIFGSSPKLLLSVIEASKTGDNYQFSVNRFPATLGLLFQQLTNFISKLGWLILLIIFFLIKYLSHRKTIIKQ